MGLGGLLEPPAVTGGNLLCRELTIRDTADDDSAPPVLGGHGDLQGDTVSADGALRHRTEWFRDYSAQGAIKGNRFMVMSNGTHKNGFSPRSGKPSWSLSWLCKPLMPRGGKMSSGRLTAL